MSDTDVFFGADALVSVHTCKQATTIVVPMTTWACPGCLRSTARKTRKVDEVEGKGDLENSLE